MFCELINEPHQYMGKACITHVLEDNLVLQPFDNVLLKENVGSMCMYFM